MSIVSWLLTKYQFKNQSRQQIREIERKQKKYQSKLKKIADKTNLPVTFDNNSVTSFGNFALLETFKNTIGYHELLQKHFTVNRHHNCKYSAAELADILSDCIALGIVRFDHMNGVKSDPGYQKVKGLDQVPDERTLRYLISKLKAEDIEKLKTINRELLLLKANMESPREVWLDFDDTVVTAFGHQEGANVGYNPRYHGRKSFKIKVGFVSQTGELLNAGLYEGSANSNNGFLDFFKETMSLTGSRMVVKGIRLDKGFFDEKNFLYFEDNCLEYVCKGKMTSNTRKMISYLDQQELWRKLDDTYSVAELTVPLPSWERARRFVFIREKVKTNNDPEQPALELDYYEHEVIVTNMEDLPPEEVWRWYNKRCNVENKIDELKTGLGLDQTSQHEMLRNTAFMWFKVLAYNLLNWFRLALLPENVYKCEVTTIRRLFLNIPGNVVGNGRYRHVRLAPNAWLSSVVDKTKEKLKVLICQKAWILALDTS